MNAGQADLGDAWSSVSEKLRPDSLVDVRYAPSTLKGSSRLGIPGRASLRRAKQPSAGRSALGRKFVLSRRGDLRRLGRGTALRHLLRWLGRLSGNRR